LHGDRHPILPAHIEGTVQAIAKLHAEHYQQSTSLQRIVDRMTALVGRPGFVGLLTLAVLVWVLANLGTTWLGWEPLDPPPFAWLQGVVGLMALYMTALILATQRREDQLAGHREQLTLELAILGEQKSAKIIQLLEEMRRDDPSLANRVDYEAAAMSTPADPQAALDAIKDSHDEVVSLEPAKLSSYVPGQG
jgi:uncharacterized membrane protein